MTFAEQLQQQRQRAGSRLEELVIRQREAFADEYARMEAAAANDPQEDQESWK